MKDCILFFVKYPEPGMVKTRIGEMSSPEAAAEFYRIFVEEQFAQLRAECEADIIVFHSPESAGGDMADWLGPETRYVGQKGKDIGWRMENAFREAFLMGYERAVLVGSDIPGLSCDILAAALEGVDADTAAIGPTEDGGYYLIGFHRTGFVPEVFRKMEWSVESVFAETVARLGAKAKKCAGMPQLDDLDTIEDVEEQVVLGNGGALQGKALEAARRLLSF